MQPLEVLLLGYLEMMFFQYLSQVQSNQLTNPNETIDTKPTTADGVPKFGPDVSDDLPNSGRDKGDGIPNFGPDKDKGVPNFGPDKEKGVPNFGIDEGNSIPSSDPDESDAIPSFSPDDSSSAVSGNFLFVFCLELNISLDMCSCESTPGLCSVMSKVDEISRSTTKPMFSRTSDYSIVYAIVTSFAAVCGILGNSSVLLVAYKNWNSLSTCKVHMAELGFVNLVFSFLQMINIIPLFWTNKWLYGLVMCKLIRTLLEIGSLMTILFILIIALERFFLIMDVSKRPDPDGKFKHFTVLGGLTFVISTTIPYFLGLNIEDASGRCIQFKGAQRYLSYPYQWFVIIVFSLLPTSIITVLYSRIIHYLARKTANLNSATNGALYEQNIRTNRRIAFITLMILACFVVCTLPTRIILIYLEWRELQIDIDYHVDNNKHVYFLLTFFSYVTYPFQCTINPILYSAVDKKWRKELWQILGFRNNAVETDSGNNDRLNCLKLKKLTREKDGQKNVLSSNRMELKGIENPFVIGNIKETGL